MRGENTLLAGERRFLSPVEAVGHAFPGAHRARCAHTPEPSSAAPGTIGGALTERTGNVSDSQFPDDRRVRSGLPIPRV